MSDSEKKLMAVDSHALIHRAYHALPPLKSEKGEVVNAVYGFLLVFFKAIKDLKPDYIAAAFDLPEPTFRHEEFEDYKAQRPETPEELTQQIPKVKEMVRTFNVPVFEEEGFEADDVLGSISEQVHQDNPQIEVIVVSGDLDTMQLVDDNTKVYTLRKGVKDTVVYDKEAVQERYGLEPNQLIDFKALKGDPSDNVPGVPQVGKKRATKLLKEFGTLENLYQSLKEKETTIVSERIQNILLKNKEQAFFSKKLVTIRKDVPLDFDLEDCEWNYDRERVVE
ncbi:MAG: 5'-3' exonuclease H3TH domain-containing protein, partial [Candidatus Paceibacterota bacterium]